MLIHVSPCACKWNGCEIVFCLIWGQSLRSGVILLKSQIFRVTMVLAKPNHAFDLKARCLWVLLYVPPRLHIPWQMGLTCVSSLVLHALHKLFLLDANQQLALYNILSLVFWFDPKHAGGKRRDPASSKEFCFSFLWSLFVRSVSLFGKPNGPGILFSSWVLTAPNRIATRLQRTQLLFWIFVRLGAVEDKTAYSHGDDQFQHNFNTQNGFNTFRSNSSIETVFLRSRFACSWLDDIACQSRSRFGCCCC